MFLTISIQTMAEIQILGKIDKTIQLFETQI